MQRKHLAHHWKRVPRHIRIPVVLIVGVTIVVIGAALLVLPGPGWVIIFAGVAILASEFAIAERFQTKLINIAKQAGGAGKRFFQKLFKR